jgi:F1F0 ATPase subunit 2
MTSFPFIEAARALAALAAGAAVGAGHFATLGPNSRLFGAGRTARAFGLQAARMAATSAALFALARLGALPLVAGLAGFLAARGVALRAATRREAG